MKNKEKTILRKRRNTIKKYNIVGKLPYVFVLLIITFCVIAVKLIMGEGDWVSDSKLAVVQPTKNMGDVTIVILDPSFGETTSIIIPSSTEVEVAGNLGRRKMGTLWELGLDEKLDGKLLHRTIVTNFLFPIEGWVGPDIDLLNFGVSDKLFFIFGKGDTSLGIRDRLRIVYFLTGLTGKNTNIKLAESTLIKSTTLSDGSSGYELTGIRSDNIFSYFVDNKLSENSEKIMIKKTPSLSKQAEILGKIIEVWGAKPAYSTFDDNHSITDSCVIYTSNTYFAKKFSNTFGCKTVFKKSDIFDVEILIGEKIIKEF